MHLREDPVLWKKVLLEVIISRALAMSQPSEESYIHSFWCFMVTLTQKEN